MKRIALFSFLVCVLASVAIAQPTLKLFPTSGYQQASTSINYSIDPKAASIAYNSSHFITGGVTIPLSTGAVVVSLDMQEFSVIGEETHFLMINGNTVTEATLPTVKTYRGSVKSVPNSKAFLAIKPNGDVTGTIQINGEDFNISTPQNGQYASIITPMASIYSLAGTPQCELNDAASYDMKAHYKNAASQPKSLASPQNTQAATKTAIVAIDVDNQCYQNYGDAINDYLVSVFGQITTVYESELDMAMQLGTVHVYTTADPYTGSDLNSMLNSFTNTYPGNNASVSRTMAHLISRKINSGGSQGLAWVDVMCDKVHGYGVSNITPSPGIIQLDASVIAHELGHNVGSFHTHDCAAYPPNGIDHCVAAEGGCSWTPQQITGTIMSYCNNKTFTFGSRVQDTLRVRIDAATCLSSLAQIQVKVDTIDFRNVMVLTKKDSTVTAIIKNPGTIALKVLGISIENDIDTNFLLKNPPKFPLNIAPGATQTITITFAPKYGGDLTADLRIFHNATGGSNVIPLLGRGIQPGANFPFTTYDFGSVTDRLPHDSTFDLVENTGDAPLQIKRLYIAGKDAKEFSLINTTPPITVDTGKSTKVGIRFTAQSNGVKDAVLRIISNDIVLDSMEIGLGANVEGLGVHNSALPNGVTLSITPNPTSSVINLSLDGLKDFAGKNITATLFDKLGKKVVSLHNGVLVALSVNYNWQLPKTISAGSYTLVLDLGATRITRELIVQ